MISCRFWRRTHRSLRERPRKMERMIFEKAMLITPTPVVVESPATNVKMPKFLVLKRSYHRYLTSLAVKV